MSQLQKIIYLTKQQYETLLSNNNTGQVTYGGITLTGVQDDNIYFITDETISASDLGNDFILPVSNGGTGKAQFTTGSLLVGNGQNALTEIGATDQNTANTIVKRDSSGNFSAGAITASLSGNATSASRLQGFASSGTSNASWGNQTGTEVCWANDSSGGSYSFRRDNPSSGKLSLIVDGRFYFNEGNTPVAGLKSANSYWGMTGPDGEDNIWIRTTSQGIIPYQSGGASAGHCQLGTDTWYFSKGYIQDIYGTLHGGAALTGTPTAPTAENGTNTTQIATTAFVNNTLSYVNAMRFKGTLGTGGTVTALPASHEAGDTYRVITAGTWAGKYCEIGTLIICTADGTTANDAHWTSVETNEDGAVIGPSSSTENAVTIWNSTNGRIIKNSTILIDTANNVQAFNLKLTTYNPNSTNSTGWSRYLFKIRDANDTSFFRMGAYGPNSSTLNYLYFGFGSSYNDTVDVKLFPNGTLQALNFQGNLTGNVTGNVSGTAANVTGTVAIDHGGTGATTAANARNNLELGTVATYNITGGNEGYSSSATLIPRIGTDGVMEVGKYIDFHASTGTSKDYDVRITAATTGLTISGTTSGTFSGSLSGNATTATTATNLSAAPTIASGGTATVNLAEDTAYTLTVGGKSVIFKTPADTATAADNILDGSNSGTAITYAPYTAKQDKLSFDTSTTAPNRTDRLNLNGFLYATKYNVAGQVTLQWNATDSSLDFVFA